MLTPIIRWMTVKCHMRRSFAVLLCLLLFFLDLVVWLPQLYRDTIEPSLQAAMRWATEFSERIGPEAYEAVSNAIPNIISSIGNAITNFSMRAVSLVSGWVTKVPSLLVSALICVIATVFMTADFHRMTAFLLRRLPERPRHVAVKAKDTFVTVVVKYGKSYGIIMAITFCELLVGLLLLKQEQAPLLALLIAVFDIFPVVGLSSACWAATSPRAWAWWRCMWSSPSSASSWSPVWWATRWGCTRW